jgi:hypothetical protein
VNRKKTEKATMINSHQRYQAGLALHHVFPLTSAGICACGCGHQLPSRRKRWFSDDCRTDAYIKFAILKGDNQVIRSQLYARDMGACVQCGEITLNWQADHIKPVYQGGGGCDLSNFQTLCLDCHQKKSHADGQRRAISSQLASKRSMRCLMPPGQQTTLSLNTSKEKHNLPDAFSSALDNF